MIYYFIILTVCEWRCLLGPTEALCSLASSWTGIFLWYSQCSFCSAARPSLPSYSIDRSRNEQPANLPMVSKRLRQCRWDWGLAAWEVDDVCSWCSTKDPVRVRGCRRGCSCACLWKEAILVFFDGLGLGWRLVVPMIEACSSEISSLFNYRHSK